MPIEQKLRGPLYTSDTAGTHAGLPYSSFYFTYYVLRILGKWLNLQTCRVVLKYFNNESHTVTNMTLEYCRVLTVMIPVSCRRNTWSLPHVSPHRNMLEDQLGSRAPSTPHFVGVPLDLEHKQFRKISAKGFSFQTILIWNSMLPIMQMTHR